MAGDLIFLSTCYFGDSKAPRAIKQVPLAIAVLLSPSLQAHRLYSKNALSWRLVTTTAGYFVYDVYVHRYHPQCPTSRALYATMVCCF